MATEPAERLLNLIIALTNARVRMTRSQIRTAVPGYTQAPVGGSAADVKAADASFERMFERDKEQLRRLGVPLETVESAYGDEIGYTINPSAAVMPSISFTSEELAAIALAAQYWQGASIAADLEIGLTKVASVNSAPPRVPEGLRVRSTAMSENTRVIIEALSRRQAIRFDYTSESSGLATRTVAPWHLLLRGGAQYVVGFDFDKKARRTFRLHRIHGGVEVIVPEYICRLPSILPDQSDSSEPTGTARIALRDDAGHALRERGTVVATDGDWDVVELSWHHLDQLRDEVLSLAGRARVVEPADLRDEVASFARAAAAVAQASCGGGHG